MSAPNSPMTAQPATSEASSALPIFSALSVAPSAAPNTTPSATPSAVQARAAQRKELQLKRQAYATTGVMEQAHTIPDGREIVPQPNAAARDKAEGFYPCTGPQFTFLKKYFRSAQVQEVVAEDGTVVRITFKQSTLDEALKLVLVCEILKSNQRGLFLDQLQDYFLAPNGLGPKDHQKTRALLEALAPSHILALAQNCTDPWWQALFQEARGAWADPKEAGFSCCDLEIPAKPKVEHATKLIQALGERRKLWPEPLRCLCDDLIKPLNICQPGKLRDFMELVNALLKLNSQELLNELMILSQILPQDFGFDALIHPKEFADAGCDMHKRLQATMIAPKTKKSAVKKNAVKTAAQKKTASKKTDASKKAADKNTSAKRAGSKAKSSAGQAQVAAQQAQAVPQQTQAAAQPATPTLAAQAPADAQGAPSTQAVNAPQDSAVKRTEDPKGSSHGAGANSGLRARETIAAELAQRRARKQKELRRKHNKEARKQRKSANRRK